MFDESEVSFEIAGLPPDHWYAVYIIKSPEGLALPVQYGLKSGEDTELVCPPDMAGITPVEGVTGQNFEESSWPTAFPCADLPGQSIGDFQAGLATGAAVQSHDGSHRYLATVVPRPLRGSTAWLQDNSGQYPARAHVQSIEDQIKNPAELPRRGQVGLGLGEVTDTLTR